MTAAQLAMFPAAPGRLVIVGCSRGKLDYPAPAALLYTGSYFRLCLAAGLAVADPGRVLILSARYGLLSPDEPIRPYNLTIGDPGAVTVAELADQAQARGIAREPVMLLCGARYADLCRQVWSDVAAPLAHLGIGKQRHVLSSLRDGAR